MTVDDLIANAESRLRSTKRDHDESKQRLTGLQRQIADGHDYDQADVDAAISRHASLTDQLDAIRGELDQLRADKARDLEVAAMQQQSTPTNVTRGGQSMSQTGKTFVVAEPSQYTEHSERTGGPSFLTDLFGAQVKNDSQAHERLARHGREMEATLSKRTGTTTSTVPSFVPPAYVTELFAAYARRGRPFANLLQSYPLPPTGMTVTIPRITTPSTVAVQSTENTAIQDSAISDTGLDLDVVTVGGYVPVSRQSLERGVMVEDMVWNDLAGAYAEQLDQLVIAAAAAQSGTNDITFTDNTSPTVIEMWPKLADAIGRVRSLSFRGATSIVMHPRRWSWCLAALSSDDDRPIFPVTAANPVNAMGVGTSTEYDEPAGQVLGLPVWLDANIPTNSGAGTNEDTIFVLDGRDSVIFEEPNKAPNQLKFEAVGGSTLTVNLVAYGYSAFTFGRHPASLSKITGSGLAAPGAL